MEFSEMDQIVPERPFEGRIDDACADRRNGGLSALSSPKLPFRIVRQIGQAGAGCKSCRARAAARQIDLLGAALRKACLQNPWLDGPRGLHSAAKIAGAHN